MDRWSMWMQDGCKVYMDSYMALNGIMFHGHLDYIQKPSLGGRPNTKPGDHDTPNAHNRWFILLYLMWLEINWNNIWLRAQSHMISHYIWGFVTTVHDLGTAFGHFLLDSHHFMVMALGSCVKWSLTFLSLFSHPLEKYFDDTVTLLFFFAHYFGMSLTIH